MLAETAHYAPFIPASWKQLLRQIENLAQFGGAVQVISGAESSGKTTFLKELARHSLAQDGLVIWPVIDEAWPGQSLQKLLEILGNPVSPGQSLGESIVALRRYCQGLQRQKKRVVVAVDNADSITDASLSGVASVLQGGAEEGFGLHLIFFAEHSLAERLDALQLIDVSVYDFDLPCFTLQEITELLTEEYEQLAQREAIKPLGADTIQDIWLESQGLPGQALMLAREHWAMNMGQSSGRFSISGLPVMHLCALALLLGVLVWALWMRDKPDAATTELAQPVPLNSLNSSLPIEMKQVPNSDLALVPASERPAQAGPEPVASAPAASTETAPAPSPSSINSPQEALAASAAQLQATKQETLETAKADALRAEAVKEDGAKLAESKPAETRPAEPKQPETKPAASQPVSNPTNAASTKPAAKPAETLAGPAEEPPPSLPSGKAAKTEKTEKPLETSKATPSKAEPKNDTHKTEMPKTEAIKTPAKDQAPAPSLASGAKRLSQLPEDTYVLQVMVSASAKKVEDVLAGAPNRRDLAAYRTERDGKAVYILVEGNYPNANAAAAAAKNLPAMQQSAKPWPKKVGLIHAELKAAAGKN
jgi:DamX protein